MFEKINKICDLVVPQFFSLDNILVNKNVLRITDAEILKEFYGKSSQEEIEKELIEIEDFNFYLEHLEAALKHLLSLEFLQFYK